MSEPAQQTDAEARTETGELIDARDRQTPETQAETSTTTTETPKNESEAAKAAEKTEGKDDKSFLNAKDAGDKKDESKSEGAPEKYEPFTIPEGAMMDEATLKAASDLFKEANMSQAVAQKFVDFYTTKATEMAQASYNAYREVRDGWRKEIMADPNIGPRAAEVKTTIGRAIDAVVGVEGGNKFRAAMDLTGAGDNPDFVRTFYAMAQRLTEGKFVQGNGPSEKGQGTTARPESIAKAMYPNNP